MNSSTTSFEQAIGITPTLRDFWINIRIGMSSFLPSVIADSAKISPNYIERQLRRADLWLTPKVVDGFDGNEFKFLSDQEKNDLEAAVDQFKKIAESVPPDKPATPEQTEKALSAFMQIAEILSPDRYADLEAFIIGKKIDSRVKGRLPKSIVELRYETGIDSHGGRALWIWVVLKDEVGNTKEKLVDTVKEIRHLIEHALGEMTSPYWPYLRFRTESDLIPLDQANKAGK